MSFETEAELSLTVDEGDLRSVRQQIEDGIGTTAVGVTDGGSMSAQSTGSSGGGGRRARRGMRLAEVRTEYLEDIALYLESIDDAVSEGGLLGGGGGLPGSGIFAEVIGAGAETAGDIGVEAGDTVADAVSDVLTGTVASTLGNTISSAINGSTVAVEPNPLPVEGGGSGGTNVTVSPTIRPTVEPDLAPDFDFPDLPDLNFGVPERLSVDRTPLPVEREPLPVEDSGPIPVEDVGPISVRFDPGSGGGSGGGATGSSDGVGGVQLGGENGLTIGPGGVQFGGDNGITLGEDPGDPTGTQSGPATGGGARDISVTHSPTYSVEVDPRRLDSLAERIISEIEEDIERDLNTLEDDVDELERELDELERDIIR